MITRNDIAAVTAGSNSGWDNVAIALASYFSYHLDRPDDDEEDETGWGVWVIEQTNAIAQGREHSERPAGAEG